MTPDVVGVLVEVTDGKWAGRIGVICEVRDDDLLVELYEHGRAKARTVRVMFAEPTDDGHPRPCPICGASNVNHPIEPCQTPNGREHVERQMVRAQWLERTTLRRH